MKINLLFSENEIENITCLIYMFYLAHFNIFFKISYAACKFLIINVYSKALLSALHMLVIYMDIVFACIFWSAQSVYLWTLAMLLLQNTTRNIFKCFDFFFNFYFTFHRKTNPMKLLLSIYILLCGTAALCFGNKTR